MILLNGLNKIALLNNRSLVCHLHLHLSVCIYNNSGTDNDVIITGVSTYAQADKVSSNVQPNKQGATFIRKRVNFDKFPKQPPPFQNNRNPRPSLLNNPPMQCNNRAPVTEGTKQMTNQLNLNYQNQNMPQGRDNPNRGYNPNLNLNPFYNKDRCHTKIHNRYKI